MKDCEFCTPQAARACRDADCRAAGMGEPASECECFPVDNPFQYAGHTEPGGALEYNPECPEHGRGSAEIAQEHSGDPVTPVDGGSGDSVAISGQESALKNTGVTRSPEVWLLPDGRVAWEHRRNEWGWLSTSRGTAQAMWFDPSTLPLADAQRMVPVGPLRELAAKLHESAGDTARVRQMSTAYSIAADRLDAVLGALLGESPGGGR